MIHHAVGSAGAQCINCHMPGKVYMQIDLRRDHSFRIPRPDLTDKIGTPNACALNPDDPDVLYALVVLYMNQKKWTQALRFANALKQLVPESERIKSMVQYIELQR